MSTLFLYLLEHKWDAREDSNMCCVYHGHWKLYIVHVFRVLSFLFILNVPLILSLYRPIPRYSVIPCSMMSVFLALYHVRSRLRKVNEFYIREDGIQINTGKQYLEIPFSQMILFNPLSHGGFNIKYLEYKQSGNQRRPKMRTLLLVGLKSEDAKQACLRVQRHFIGAPALHELLTGDASKRVEGLVLPLNYARILTRDDLARKQSRLSQSYRWVLVFIAICPIYFLLPYGILSAFSIPHAIVLFMTGILSAGMMVFIMLRMIKQMKMCGVWVFTEEGLSFISEIGKRRSVTWREIASAEGGPEHYGLRNAPGEIPLSLMNWSTFEQKLARDWIGSHLAESRVPENDC